jgi:hypothetical protein
MELGGTEKRIQALFSELSLEDRSCVPRFERLWTQTTRPAPVFRRSLALAAAVVVIVAVASLLWSKQSQIVLDISPLEIPTPQLALIVEPPRPQQPRQKRIVRPRRTDRVVFSDAALLSRWQSPTQSFMESPTGTNFNSLPQLNQSAKDLESFLPKTNEMKKESNR